MDKNDLFKIANIVRTKADEYKNALEICLIEIKRSGRTLTEEDTEKMQAIKVKLLTQLNRHAKIYKLIYELN